MPGNIGKNLTTEGIKDIIVSSQESKGLINSYIDTIWDYVPNLSTSLSKASDIFCDIVWYIPGGGKLCKANEIIDDALITLKVPNWFIGNLTEWVRDAGSTYKSLSGLIGGGISIKSITSAVRCKDPICLALSTVALTYDLIKMGSNIFPYNHNCTKNDTINYGLKLTVYACEQIKICDKLGKAWGFVKRIPFRKIGRFLKK